MDGSERKQLTFRLLKTSEILLQIRGKESCEISEIKESNLIVDINFEVVPKKEQSVISLSITVIFIYDDQVKPDPVNLLAYTNVFDFWIKNFDDIVEAKNDGVEMESYAIILFLGIAISTTRGILIEKCSNSDLKGLIMPVIDPADIYNKKMAMQQNKLDS